ncbi:ligase-associated DNA damage response endonuclease PdeM [Cognatiyoonia sp. IB215446]|uniref:ligase-associated DNA damage response endonuclease PdeM n=1 Tax=Cognatiyoonia sp. IB215446 TaxID=3097355 RepID=UPI002A0DA487|nr:ligase-associated DNA damage response endonuclease PdeM [Cognatiyoonia sp. IB215446]MDX8347264.1 ligase-associated DNA damage response endonuclease PdeM [Cognatiyoonia sp. IB215446]
MNGHNFILCGTRCTALPTGALYLPDQRTLCVSDLHLGKSDRIARRSGLMLPPYEVQQTLEKLQDDIHRLNPQRLICLGDSFDDLDAAESLNDDMRLLLTGLQAGREWIWIEGNHDPGPVDLGGAHLAQIEIGTLTFRHIATREKAEVSGHYHPKHRLTGRSRPAFVYDTDRLILPAYGAYTGGLSCNAPDLRKLFGPKAVAVLTGKKAIAVPLTETRQPVHLRGRSY